MKRGGILLVFVFALLSCAKDDGSRIPETFVDYKTTVQEFESLKGEYDILLVEGHGIAGLLIYKAGAYDYRAYDRCSSYEPEKRCAVVRQTAFTVKDPCSGSVFSLSDGAVQQGPAVRNLKRYRVRVVNNFNILVSND
ncbi:MAG: hypothetical protein H7Y13_03175 [Sphingobacteriaceae bacterium]|nr:hypothetical protein [Sphingobacteriaceae bacterium]